mmetsp:Transcript_67457/g.163181  ORF Transcript_67457/g.163181 Transcript_67457/m.163181 type:complete len:254 (+) Transcript_67457:971-1732(+)
MVEQCFREFRRGHVRDEANLSSIADKHHEQRAAELEPRVAVEHERCECDHELAPNDDHDPVRAVRSEMVVQLVVTLAHRVGVPVRHAVVATLLSPQQLILHNEREVLVEDTTDDKREANRVHAKSKDCPRQQAHLQTTGLPARDKLSLEEDLALRIWRVGGPAVEHVQDGASQQQVQVVHHDEQRSHERIDVSVTLLPLTTQTDRLVQVQVHMDDQEEGGEGHREELDETPLALKPEVRNGTLGCSDAQVEVE